MAHGKAHAVAVYAREHPAHWLSYCRDVTVAASWTETSGGQESPLDYVLDHAVDMLEQCINRGENELPERDLDQRVDIVTLLNHLIVMDKNFSVRGRSHPHLMAMLFYERTRLGCMSTGYFLEGCPAGLPLFSGECLPYVPNPADQSRGDLTWIRLRDVVSDRLQTIGKLEALPPTSKRRLRLYEQHQINDLHDNVPPPVRVFISRVRSICQGLMNEREPKQFRQCQNRCCNRLFFVGSHLDSNSVHIGVNSVTGTFLSPGEQDSGDEEENYWKQAMDVTATQATTPYYKRFCSTNCRREWHTQLASAMPQFNDHELDSDRLCRKQGVKRVSEAFRCAMKRNHEAARCIRTTKRSRKGWPALSEKDKNTYVRRRVRMLNLDAGVLYAATQIAAVKELHSSRKLLAGSVSEWRKDAMYYKRALKMAISEYKHSKHNPDVVIGDSDSQHTFFVRLKRKATEMF